MKRPWRGWVYLVLLIIVAAFGGCASAGDGKAPILPDPPDLTPVQADATALAQHDSALQTSWNKVADALNAPTAATQPISLFIEQQQAALQAMSVATGGMHDDVTRLTVDLGVVTQQNTKFTTAATALKKDDDKTHTALTAAKTDDPTQDRIRDTGLVIAGLGLLAVIAGLAVPVLRAIPAIWEAGAAAVGFGALLLLIARYLHTLEWIAGGVVIAGLVIAALWYVKRNGLPSWLLFWQKKATPAAVSPVPAGAKM